MKATYYLGAWNHYVYKTVGKDTYVFLTKPNRWCYLNWDISSILKRSAKAYNNGYRFDKISKAQAFAELL